MNNNIFHSKWWFWLQVVTCLFIIAGVIRHWNDKTDLSPTDGKTDSRAMVGYKIGLIGMGGEKNHHSVDVIIQPRES